MGLLKKIFRKKNKEREVDVEEHVEEVYDEDEIICTQCNMAIHPGQRVKTYAGKKMHMKPCWFKMQKMAKSFM